jgi:hypothetical protein
MRIGVADEAINYRMVPLEAAGVRCTALSTRISKGGKLMLFCAGAFYRTAEGRERFGLLSSFGGVPIISDDAEELFQELGHLGHVYALHKSLRKAELAMVSSAPDVTEARPFVRFTFQQYNSISRSVSRAVGSRHAALSCT